MFYPEIKPHISPSALAAWHHQRSMFVRSYFKGEKTPDTAAMRGGKTIHALIENGIVEPVHRFHFAEADLRFVIPGKDVEAFGKPDSHEVGDVAQFVDYKTGKENAWTREKLATDLKMKFTAWLVLQDSRLRGFEPGNVRASIEYIPTQWNKETKEVEPVPDGEHEVISYDFSVQTLDTFTTLIQNTVDEVNEAYPKFLEASEEVVDDDDLAEYARLEGQKKEIEQQQEQVKERIEAQMELGNLSNISRTFGTFYITERKTYEYPDDLELQDEDGEIYSRAKAEQIVAAKKAAEKQYEQEHTPKNITRSVGFRPAKKK